MEYDEHGCPIVKTLEELVLAQALYVRPVCPKCKEITFHSLKVNAREILTKHCILCGDIEDLNFGVEIVAGPEAESKSSEIP